MRRFCLLVFVCILLGNKAISKRMRFDNHYVYRIRPKDLKEIAVLKTFENANSGIAYLDAVANNRLDIIALVAPNASLNFLTQLEEFSITFELLDINAQATLEDNTEPVADSNRRTNEYYWTEYHELNDTYNWMHNLEKAYPNVATVFIVGYSFEGRPILGLKISNGLGNQAVFLEAGMHAREWISPATATYIANKLLSSKATNVRSLAVAYDWYIVPHTNPDGYVYTHTTNRLWRKTRTPYGKNCFGADPNRNFDFHWNEVAPNYNPCSETYAGPIPFSEKETRSLANFLNNFIGKLFLYVSFHSYSQLLLYPYGYTSELPSNYDDLKRVFEAAILGIRSKYGTKYGGGNIYDAIYPASGSSTDWTYGVLKTNYSYCYELRPSMYNLWTGFRLPATQIIPTGEETLDSLIAMVKSARSITFEKHTVHDVLLDKNLRT